MVPQADELSPGRRTGGGQTCDVGETHYFASIYRYNGTFDCSGRSSRGLGRAGAVPPVLAAGCAGWARSWQLVKSNVISRPRLSKTLGLSKHTRCLHERRLLRAGR